MLYPNAARVAVSDFIDFFVTRVRPSLPEPRAMRNGSLDSPLRSEISVKGYSLVVSNTYRSLLLGIR
jgi:hypothetical protein